MPGNVFMSQASLLLGQINCLFSSRLWYHEDDLIIIRLWHNSESDTAKSATENKENIRKVLKDKYFRFRKILSEHVSDYEVMRLKMIIAKAGAV